MKRFKKVCLWIIGISILVIVIVAILPSPKSPEVQKLVAQKAAAQKAEAVKKTKEVKVLLPQVTLNYKDGASVTHQQIIDVIKENVASELKSEDYDCRLKKVEIKDKKISVYLDLQFEPQSKSWIIKEGKSWLWYVAVQGFMDDDNNLIGNVYSTGYDISVSMWTWLDGDEVIPWGHAIIFNSGKPFTEHSVELEGRWQDGRGMEMLK